MCPLCPGEFSETSQVEEGINFEHGRYISALTHIKMVILSIYVLLECINKMYNYGHA